MRKIKPRNSVYISLFNYSIHVDIKKVLTKSKTTRQSEINQQTHQNAVEFHKPCLFLDSLQKTKARKLEK